MPQEAAAFLDAVAAEASEVFEIASRIRKPQSGDPKLPEHLRWPFDYDAILIGDPRLDDEGTPYGPMMAADGRQYPPRIEDLPDEAKAYWEGLLAEASNPLVTSRLADLLWLSRYGDSAYRFAERAVADLVASAAQTLAMIQAADGDPSPVLRMQAVELLQRAATIAREINHDRLRESVADEIESHLRFATLPTELKPGVIFGLVDAYEALGLPDRPDGIEVAVQKLVDATDDPWTFESGSERLAHYTADPTEQQLLREEVVRRWLSVGDARTDIARISFYQDAFDAAERFGLANLRDEAAAAIQRRPVHREDFTPIEVSLEIPRGEADEQIARLSRGSTWAESLESLLASGPLARTEPDTVAAVEQERSGFSGILPVSVLSELGAVITTIPGGEAGNATALVQRQGQQVQIGGAFVAEAIKAIAAALGSPQAGELSGFFDQGLAADVAEAFARAAEHHLAGRYDESVHVAYPRIERCVREFARDAGLTVIKMPRGQTPGGVRTLGAILHELSSITRKDPIVGPWFRYFEIALTNPLGSNIRNIYAHGLSEDGTEIDSAVLIHIAVALRSLSVAPQPD